MTTQSKKNYTPITKKIAMFFSGRLSAAASNKFIQRTKVVLIKIFGWGIFQRIKGIAVVIFLIIKWTAIVLWFISIFFGSYLIALIMIIVEIILFIPNCILWFVFGVWWCGNLIKYVGEKTVLFKPMKMLD